MNKDKKTIKVLIQGKEGKNSIYFERAMSFRDASMVLVGAMVKPSRKVYTKKAVDVFEVQKDNTTKP